MSAREGSLRDLQSALDRRKFAIAKDDISPNGCTPLHVATVFGHAGEIFFFNFIRLANVLETDKRKFGKLYMKIINEEFSFYKYFILFH